MSTEPSTIGSLRRRGLFFAMFALAACDSDPTPIVPMAAAGGGSPGAGEAGTGRDSNKLGPNDRLRIYSLRTTDPHWRVHSRWQWRPCFPLDRQRPSQRLDNHRVTTEDCGQAPAGVPGQSQCQRRSREPSPLLRSRRGSKARQLSLRERHHCRERHRDGRWFHSTSEEERLLYQAPRQGRQDGSH